MSLVEMNMLGTCETGSESGQRPLHRLEEVRRLQGVSRRTVARRLGADITAIKEQEKETTDLPLSVLYQWQKVLDVPVNELLVESDEPLSKPILARAQMVRLMKTALSIQENATEPAVQRMAETLIEQLTQMMPELKSVSPWHAVGQRRRLDEYGAAAFRHVATDLFLDRD